jgi:hypothetical protein
MLHARINVTVFIAFRNGFLLVNLKLGRSRTRADSELQFHRTTLNFAGAQYDYFIIMITTVPVRSYGPIYSRIYSFP